MQWLMPRHETQRKLLTTVAPAASSAATAGAVLAAGSCVARHVGLPNPVMCPSICTEGGRSNDAASKGWQGSQCIFLQHQAVLTSVWGHSMIGIDSHVIYVLNGACEARKGPVRSAFDPKGLVHPNSILR